MSLSGGTFDYTGKCARHVEVIKELEKPEVWKQHDRLSKLNREKLSLEKVITGLSAIGTELDSTRELLVLSETEADAQMIEELGDELEALEKQVDKIEFQRMFSGELDMNNAFLEINAGSGGTEAQDWAEMLLRMYLRWAESHGFEAQLMEVSSGEVAGIKSVSAKISGDFVYGWLRTENGVHRLVRKSPFDSGNRRHTSFAAVFVSPEIDDDIVVEINPDDLRIDVYRASGAGGQHVNKTESAVRITHLPTLVVVQCQNQRSQHRNREMAMKQLKAKLYQLEMNERLAEQKKIEEAKVDIGWGSQIRSYVLDQSRIKDLRTQYEMGNTQAVLDGRIDGFLEESLKQGL